MILALLSFSCLEACLSCVLLVASLAIRWLPLVCSHLVHTRALALPQMYSSLLVTTKCTETIPSWANRRPCGLGYEQAKYLFPERFNLNNLASILTGRLLLPPLPSRLTSFPTLIKRPSTTFMSMIAFVPRVVVCSGRENRWSID